MVVAGKNTMPQNRQSSIAWHLNNSLVNSSTNQQRIEFQMLVTSKQFFCYPSQLLSWPAVTLINKEMKLAWVKSLFVVLSPFQINNEAFFVQLLLIASFFLLKLFHKVRRFFTNVNLSNNYPHRSIFSP